MLQRFVAVLLLLGLSGRLAAQPAPRTLVFPGGTADERAGQSVLVTDLTADGVADLVIGCPNWTGERLNGGRVLVYFGGRGTFAGRDTRRPDVIFAGSHARMQFGAALAAGDVNGDGAPDLIMGAPLATGPAGTRAGSVHVVWGGRGFPRNQTIDLFAAPAPLTLSGPAAECQLGRSLHVADLDGDGIGDVLAGAPFHRPGGAVIVIRGRRTGRDVPSDLAKGGVDLLILGAEGDGLGVAVAAGDFDGDGARDIAATAHPRSLGHRSAPGHALLVRGGPAAFAQKIVTADGSEGTLRLAASAELDLGVCVLAGRLDDDACEEAIFGLPGLGEGRERGRGGAAILRGGPDFFGTRSVHLESGSAGTVVLGGAAGERQGHRLLLLGSAAGRPDLLSSSVATARVLRFPSFAPDRPFETAPEVHASEDALRTLYGTSLAAGDLDGSGTPDLAIGAPESTNAEGRQTGAVTVILR